MDYYAHTGKDPNSPLDGGQLLRDHARSVAETARERARNALGERLPWLSEAASVTGLLHDLGKYRQGFQRHLEGRHFGPEGERYHKQAGAAKAKELSMEPVAFAIAGHHGGMPDDLDDLEGPSGDEALTEIWPMATADCPELSAIGPANLALGRLEFDLATRILFSCLVDADWSDTAEHERKDRGWEPDPVPPKLEDQAEAWIRRVQTYIAERARDCTEPIVAEARADVLRSCLRAAEGPAGFYSLTVPTGGGKTLSGLAFALTHARRNGLRRIIYVSPYLSILDQNAGVIRKALGVGPGDQAVFEHHSLADPISPRRDDDPEETRRESAVRRAENWDAPVVLTTNVMFFESLFSNRPGRCRKLHNIARSVILLDECQSLPPDLVASTCSMLNGLVETLGCTVVLATATQPAFDHPELHKQKSGLVNVHEITQIERPDLDLFKRLERVRITWPERDEVWDWEDVARQMTERKNPAALCIVNTKRAAKDLFEALKRTRDKGVFHLSTAMCPAHRLATLKEIRSRLDPNNMRPCLVVSTQLIEAGVDVDFPLVLRELAPLEAIIQAAGRCNREGKLNGRDGSPGGMVIVFRSRKSVEEPRKYYPPDLWYKAGRGVVETDFLNADREPRIDDPGDIREYYERLFRAGDLDKREIQVERRKHKFACVAEKYRLIDEQGVAVVVAKWDKARNKVARLLEDFKPNRSYFRELAPYQVNIRAKSPIEVLGVYEKHPGLFVWDGLYDKDLGLTLEDDLDRFVVWP